MSYTDINVSTIERWIEEGWEWGIPITHEIYEKAKNSENHGMGTTATLAFVYDSKLIIAHIGDSRCYKVTTDEIFLSRRLRRIR